MRDVSCSNEDTMISEITIPQEHSILHSPSPLNNHLLEHTYFHPVISNSVKKLAVKQNIKVCIVKKCKRKNVYVKRNEFQKHLKLSDPSDNNTDRHVYIKIVTEKSNTLTKQILETHF